MQGESHEERTEPLTVHIVVASERVDIVIGHKEKTKLFAMRIVVDTEKVGTEMAHMMKRTTYHIYCHIAVVTEKVATEIGQSKDTESSNVCIVVET